VDPLSTTTIHVHIHIISSQLISVQLPQRIICFSISFPHCLLLFAPIPIWFIGWFDRVHRSSSSCIQHHIPPIAQIILFNYKHWHRSSLTACALFILFIFSLDAFPFIKSSSLLHTCRTFIHGHSTHITPSVSQQVLCCWFYSLPLISKPVTFYWTD
jgi:hypothetical protein